jgi:PAS domain S-box-containing protein
MTGTLRGKSVAAVSLVPSVESGKRIRGMQHMEQTKQTNEQHVGDEIFLASIVESSDDAIFAMSLGGTVLSWNSGAEEVYGYSASEIVGKPAYLLCPADRVPEIVQNLERLKRGEHIRHFETVRVRKDGRHIDASITISLVKNGSGTALAAAVIARDITEQKQAREAIDSANRIKSQFLDNMNHEIRTPMNGILGMTELMLDTELTAEQRENLGLVKVSTESLLAAIDDILDFSEIDSGRFKLESIPFDFRESLGETMKMLGFRAQKKSLELVYEVAPAIPETLGGDPGRLRRIIQNLVGNAIKFTDRGEIVVTAEEQSRADKRVCLLFSVRDTGIGISAEQQKTIFQPFRQADGSLTRKYGGTGLGLTIAARLVALMNGKIWLDSKPGRGSTFYFTAELNTVGSGYGQSTPLPFADLRDLPVLIVDDNAVNRRVLRGMLSHWGMKASDVANGNAALEVLRVTREIGHPFALVLLDGQMREMDGFTLAEQIKKDPSLAGATIMMLTSVGHVGDAARCRDLEIAAYLVKPVRLSELVNAVCLALKKTASHENDVLITRHTLREAKNLSPLPNLDPSSR